MLGIGEYICLSIIIVLIISTLFTKYVAIGLIVTIIALIIWKINNFSNYWKIRNIPSPKGTFGIGNLFELFTDFKGCDEKWKKEFGETYGIMMGTVPDLTTTNLDIIKEVYVKQFDKFIDRETFLPVNKLKEKDILFNNMLIKKGEDWRRVRNLCSPAFTTGKMKKFVPFFNETVDKTLEILQKYEREDKAIDIKELCDGMTIDSIFKSTFGFKTDLQENPNNITREYARKILHAEIYDPRVLFTVLFPQVTTILRQYFNYNIRNNTELKYFTDILLQCYEKRKKELDEGINNEAPDFFKVLLQSVNENDSNEEEDDKEIIFEKATLKQKKKGMSKIEILAQGFIFIIAGYETTAITTHFLLYMLAYHQEYQDRCREEILEALEGKSIDYIDYDTVNKLNYLDQCVKECLRMYPPGVKTNRVCVEKTIVNGITIEPGTMVSIPIFNLHYDEKIYPEPNVFDPERFSPEQKAERDPLYYMPFGYGPRNCIGMRYAYLSMKVYLARFLLKYKFVTCDETLPLPLEINTQGMTKPIKPLYLKVEKYVAIGLIVTITSFIIWKVNNLSYYWKKRNIPSPKGKFGFGNLLEIISDVKNYDKRWKEEFGETYGIMMGLKPNLTTTNLDIIKEIYVKQFDKFIDREGLLAGSTRKEKSIYFNSIFIKKGEDWRRIRNLCSPAFTTGKIKHFVKFFNATVDKTLEILQDHEKKDRVIDIEELCEGMAIDSIFKTTFGFNADLQEDPSNIIRSYAKKIFEINKFDLRTLFAVLFPELSTILRIYFNYHIRNDKEIKYFTDILSQCYDKRKKELEKDIHSESSDFFKVLLQSLNENDTNEVEDDKEIIFEKATQKQKRKGLSKVEILAQGFLFLLVGYETTASTTQFILFMLAHHQEYQDKCREEILKVLEGKSINYIDYDTVNKLNYLDQCVKECLRMYPPGVRTNRLCVEKTTIHGITIEPGTMVSIPIFNLHYDEKIYPEPNVFDPERFSPEQKAERDPLYYMPFGYGPRNCIGMRYAYLSMKVYLARFLLKYKFVTCDETLPLPLEINTQGMTKPIKPLYLKVEKYVAIGLIVTITSFIIWKVNNLSYYWKKRNIPSPKGKFGFGNLLEIISNVKNYDKRWKEEFGETYGIMMGLKPNLTTTNLDIIKEIYVKQFDKFIDREGLLAGSTRKEKSIYFNSIFIKKGEDWRRIRNLCSPAFTTGKIKHFVKFFNATVDKTLEILQDHEKKDRVIDIEELCEGMAIDSIFKTTFGFNADLQEDPSNIIRSYAKKIFEINKFDLRTLFAVLFPELSTILRIYFNYHIRNDKEIKYFTDILSQCYDKRKKELEKDIHSESSDFFKVLLQSLNENDTNEVEDDKEIIFEKATQKQKRKGLSKVEILAQGFLFLLVGYETTASTTQFILFMLAHHQEYQDKCREEILKVLEGKSINYIDYDTVNKLNYLDQCVKECLRMYPPAPRINRVCVEKTTIHGITFEPGTTVSIPMFNLHYDEKIYPQPNIFDPERFSSEQKAGRDPLYYLPFGYGPRNCIGMRYAYLSMKVYLARFLLNYKFKTCDETLPLPLEIITKRITKPIKKLYLKAEKVSY
uniref:Cytochrome P450 n=1 Tax=Strongyloides stercoralis TaxID=6248 RepID=A0AAF5D3J7_STRER